MALSYEDIREKVKILRWVAENIPGSNEDKKLARDVAEYLEFCYDAATKPVDGSIGDNEEWDIYSAMIHGQQVTYRIEGDEDWLLAQGFAQDTLDMVNYWVTFQHV